MPDRQKIEKIGLTMRTDEASGRSETRDGLAMDWHGFMDFAIPEVAWVPVPNIGEKAAHFIKDWPIGGIILTGGNDLGASVRRDATEEALLRQAISDGVPVFGVCRGLQMIQAYFGGSIARCPSQSHAGVNHAVSFCPNPYVKYGADEEIAVNSYHNYGVKADALSEGLVPFVVTKDGWVEGLMAKDYPILAILWHPERGLPFREYDRAIVRGFFGI